MAPQVFSLILSVVWLLNGSGTSARYVEKYEREFSERLTVISVQNPRGLTEVRTWTKSTVKFTASGLAALETIRSDVSFERPAPDHLRISISARDANDPLTVTLYVPASIHVAVRSVAGSVVVFGAPAGLSVDTETGEITLHIPGNSNADISLRALEGIIDSRVPMKPFGHSDGHILDARTGVGGSALIARSLRGGITVLPDASSLEASPARTEALKAELSAESSGGSKLAPNSSSSIGVDRSHAGEEVIKLEARLVNLNVKVTDAAGKTLPVLMKENFLIYEDDILQDLSYFEPVTAPLNIVLLLDLSGSTEHKMKVIKKAAQKFVDSLNPSDRIAVAGFTRRFFIISNFTTDHNLLKDRIGDIKNRHSGTAYYDAMWSTLDLLDEARATRKAVVVLTDGVDNSLDHPDDSEFDPKHGFDELLARIEEADATIYPIYLDTEYETIGSSGRSGHAAYVTARRQLAALAEQTGAMMFRAERAEDLEGVYRQVAAELHSLYSMAYAPKIMRKDGKWRKVTISVNLPGAKARTKRGYFAK
ncbi:MAG: VWA domain-containing protein [Blastocatellia bacterium]